MNNDYLRVNSKDEQSGVEEGKFAAKTDVRSDLPSDKTTLFSLFSSKKNKNKDFITKFPTMSKVFVPFLFSLSIVMFLFLVALIAKDVAILMIASFLTATVMPFFFIAFFYELNRSKNVSVIDMICGLTIGIAYFITIVQLYKYVLPQLNQTEWLTEGLYAAIGDLGLFLVSYLFVRISKKANVTGSMLLVIAVYSGFVFAKTALACGESLFTAEIIGKPYPVLAIFRSGDYFDKVISSFVITVIKAGIYEAFLYFLWATVCGGVVSLRISPIKDIYRDSSLYLLVVLQIILHVLLVIGSALSVFRVILNIACLILSVTVAVKVLNYILSNNVAKSA